MPLPTIVGTLIRRIDLHHSSAGKNKDYRIQISEEVPGAYRVYAEYGPSGRLNQGQEKTTHPVSFSEATRMAVDLCHQKENQSDAYRVVSDQTFNQPQQKAQVQPEKPEARPVPQRPRVTADALSQASRKTLNNFF